MTGFQTRKWSADRPLRYPPLAIPFSLAILDAIALGDTLLWMDYFSSFSSILANTQLDAEGSDHTQFEVFKKFLPFTRISRPGQIAG